MRYSSNSADPGYAAWRVEHDKGNTVRAFLDGQEVKGCRMADDEEGVIERCVLDGKGNVQIHPEKPDEIWTEFVKGEVSIAVEPESPRIG